MPHITTIGAGLFSDLSFSTDTAFSTSAASGYIDTDWQAFFATSIALGAAGGTGKFRRLGNVREFPQMGTPPNIVNVPVYGAKTSSQVQGQADAPTFEVTLNFVPEDWKNATDYLGKYVGNGTAYAFRFTLLNAEPAGYASTQAGLGTVKGGSAGSGKNSQYFWGGKLEALQVSPQLTDANTAIITISIQTVFAGAFTNS